MGRKSPLGYVYFVHAPLDKMVKIGWSSVHPDKRLAFLRAGSPVPLERFGFVRAGRDLEIKLHGRFRHLRDHCEWFHVSAALITYIADNTEPWDIRIKSSKSDRHPGREEHEAYRAASFAMTVEYMRSNYYEAPAVGPAVNFPVFCRMKGFMLKERRQQYP